jgi:hypothetical protein
MDIDGVPSIPEGVRKAFSNPAAQPKSMSLVEFVGKAMLVNDTANIVNFGQKIGEFLDDTFNEFRTICI